jgi:hypothetical protein
MADTTKGRIAVDDIVEAATAGVLRALDAREINGREFAAKNGFFVKFDITAGGWPGPVEPFGGGGIQTPTLPG